MFKNTRWKDFLDEQTGMKSSNNFQQLSLLAGKRAADKPVLLVVSFARIALLISYPSPLFQN